MTLKNQNQKKKVNNQKKNQILFRSENYDKDDPKDVLVKKNLDLTGFGDKSLNTEYLSGGTKENRRKEFFEIKLRYRYCGKQLKGLGLNQII